MKQKRKVKSLLPQKSFVNGKILTILLVVLSLVLCIGGVSLLTHSVSAAQDNNLTNVVVDHQYLNVNPVNCEVKLYNTKKTQKNVSVGSTIQISLDDDLQNGGYSFDHLEYDGVSSQGLSYVVKSGVNSVVVYYTISSGAADINSNNVPDISEKKHKLSVYYTYKTMDAYSISHSINLEYFFNEIYTMTGKSINRYYFEPEVVTGAKKCGQENIEFYYTAETGCDLDRDGVCDDEENIITLKYENSLSESIGTDNITVISGESFYSNLYDIWPKTLGKNYYLRDPNSVYIPAVTGNMQLTFKFIPENDCNGNGIADEEETRQITINYSCKIKDRTGSIDCIIPPYVTGYELNKPFNVPVPQVPGYRNVEPDKPVIEGSCENDQTIDVVLTLGDPEKDQNNDGIWDGAQELWEVTEFDYTGLDNKVEVLYGMRFLDPTDFTKVVNSIYMSGSVLYIAPNPVIVGSTNQVSDNVYSHILGGENNKVSSNNITLIAGSNNKIHAGNDNASILGGDGNEVMPGKNGGVPAIIVGGESNVMGTGHDGNALIGGKNNKIEDGHSNVFILGGENNKILGQDAEGHSTHSKNVIIGGKNVHIEGIDNIFVYSSKGNYYDYFSPVTQNAFYLNVENGAGINTDGIEGLSVGGAVSVGRVNISNTNILCNYTNLGVVGSYSGCLVGCTKAGLNAGGKWEMLDQGNECAEICQNNSAHCLNQEDEVVNVEDSNAQCTEGVVNTDNAHLCIDDLESYKNVIFESSLIDSDEECPNGQNICVYQCDEGFNLKQDPLNGNKRGCYGECELPWDPTQKIQHGVTITGYNVENVSCSNDIYVFPLDTEIINLGQPKFNYTKINITKNGITYRNRAKNGKSYESCGNYDHKKTLICYKGTLYLTKNDGKPDTNTAEAAKKYNRESCDLHNYRCDTGETGYNLTQQQIIYDKNDVPQNESREVADRGTLTGKRGLYDVCIDFDADPSDPSRNGEKCNTGTYHYKFKGCNVGYVLGDDGICRKDCSLEDKNGNLKGYHNNDEVIGYQITGAQCPNECTGSKLVCDDGLWHIGSKTGELATGTWYNYCKGGKKTCGSEFNVNQAEHDTYGHKSFYANCVNYNVSDNVCTTGDTVYKLTGCKENYHTENMRWCVSNTGLAQCNQGDKPANSYYITGLVHITWSGSRNSGKWSAPEDCKWACNDGYVTGSDGNSCVDPSCGNSPNTCMSGASVVMTGNSGDGTGVIWGCQANSSSIRWCAKCDENSHEVGTGSSLRCDANMTGECVNEGTAPYLCAVGSKNDRNENIGAGYTWECLGIPPENENLKSGLCHKCKDNATWNGVRCECGDGYDEVNDGGQIVCKDISYECSKTEKYKCKISSGDLVDGGNTGHSSIYHRYTWECGDTPCPPICEEGYSMDSNGNCIKDIDVNGGKIKICRDIEYDDTCGGVVNNNPEVIKRVSFRSLDGNSSTLSIDQPFVLSIAYQFAAEGIVNVYYDYSCVQNCSDGWCDYPTCEAGTPINDANEGVISICSKGNGKDYSWEQYIKNLGDVQLTGSHSSEYEYIGDCPQLEPKCGNSLNTCTYGSSLDYDENLGTWYCSNGFNEVKCSYKCDCPAGYVRNGEACTLHAEYCIGEQTRSELVQSCNVASMSYLGGISAHTCCGHEVDPTAPSEFSLWPHPGDLNKFQCNSNSDGWKGFYWTENQFVFSFEPSNSSNNCRSRDNPTELDILDECFANLNKYYGENDNGYYIDGCGNSASISTESEGCNCKVVTI